MFDPFTIFLQETKIEPKQKTEKFESVQPSTPSDSIVINEDEEKFQKYILKQTSAHYIRRGWPLG